MDVIWLPGAERDIQSILNDTDFRSAESANRLADAIARRGEQLASFPQSGRIIPEFQNERLRELIEQDFRILYEVFADRVEIFGIISARRDVFGESEPPTE